VLVAYGAVGVQGRKEVLLAYAQLALLQDKHAGSLSLTSSKDPQDL